MRVLVFTAMYPTQEKPARGTFVKEQIDVFAFDGDGPAKNYLKAGTKDKPPSQTS